MPVILVVIGVMLVVSGARGTITPLGQQLVHDFTGENNFFYWIAAILIIGAIGYIPGARYLSWGFLALVFVVLFLANGVGFWSNLQDALANATPAQAPAAATSGNPNAATFGNLGTMNPNILQSLGGFFGSLFGGT